MASVSIESLHPELIEHVCQYLDETHPPSLVAFSLVSKSFYTIAGGLLFRTIKLSFSNGKQLVHNVQHWETLLLREDAFRHVRRLILCWIEDADKERHNGYLCLEPCERYEDDLGLRSCWDLNDYYEFLVLKFSKVSITNDEWGAVAHIMKQTTGLADVFYSCPAQFPPCLLHTLHSCFPQCRFHHYAFHLRSLGEESIDPHEMSLASSPCLSSIGEFKLGGNGDARDFARHQGSRIREAHIWPPENEETAIDDMDRASRWAGTITRPPITLEIVHFNKDLSGRSLSFRTVSRTIYGDFSALCVLRLDPAIADLTHLPPPNNFPVLRTLVFTCASVSSLEYWTTLSTFLRDLPRLQTLHLRKWERSVAVVPALNSNLRHLTISTQVGAFADPLCGKHVHQLVNVCPKLEELSLEIQRSRGDAAEVSLYRALGRLRRLQHLTLNLDASPPPLNRNVEFFDHNGDFFSHGTSSQPWFDVEDAKTLPGLLCPYRQGHVKDVLVNSAIDSALARSIFELVHQAKMGLSGAVLPLERLELGTSYGDRFPRSRGDPARGGLSPFLAALHRKWLVERDVRDDARDVIHVTELDREARLNNFDDSRATHGAASSSKHVFDIWQRVWPSEEEESSWWENWKSLPLVVDSRAAG